MSFFEIDPKLRKLCEQAEQKALPRFQEIDRIAQYNSEKVLSAFIKHGVSESHFAPSTGYGYGDRGREVLDEVLAEIFDCEDALIRYNFMSGTHALTVALFGVLRPGDRMVSLTGKPYDTLHGVIGLKDDASGSLKDFGIHYEQLDLLEDGSVNYDAIPEAVKGAKVAYIQRSRGYSLRPSLFVEDIEKIVKQVRSTNPDAIIMVDNCYGEFVQEKEPTQVGADLIIGSLIKNPGGGIAPTGGYIAGKAKYVDLCAQRLSAPGVGKEIGCTLGNTRSLFMGLFFSPSVVASAVKTAVFAAYMLDKLGYKNVSPAYDEERTDIIQTLELGTKENLVNFTQGIQSASPIDSYVRVLPAPMPGYPFDEVMAAGSFTQGSTIELSADAPVVEPYTCYMQGGLTFEYGKLSILLALTNMKQQ